MAVVPLEMLGSGKLSTAMGTLAFVNGIFTTSQGPLHGMTRSKIQIVQYLVRWSAKFGQRHCLFHILIIGIKNYDAHSENPDDRVHKELSHLHFHCLQMYVEFT